MDTKEKILQTALTLFAAHGYEGVSMRDIAEEIGITKAALYRHYESKREIFNAIVKRMEEEDAKRASDFEVPEQPMEENVAPYQNTELGAFLAYTEAQFLYWTADPFASAFRRMLTLEQYHDEEMALLYQNHFGSGPLRYTADLLKEMTGSDEEIAFRLALEFFAPVAMLIQMSDHEKDKESLLVAVKRHMDRFMKTYFEK
ncbi:MAG: TetR/AcrR family transcriptional regulator [Clostridia bacterium]